MRRNIGKNLAVFFLLLLCFFLVLTGYFIDRKEQKRLEAQERQRISILKKPLEKRIAWLENEIGKLNGKKTAIDSQLADPAIYEPANKDRLKKLLADQIECTKQLNSREEEWLEKQGELEKILAS